ncbi:hypothetical protein [Acrocarpospora sp. B8E8]|uniref:hypothetical protein n=1 Tax=Acrocarpospora sp. B8E8 TaxID=3153572 RepID=UPI00325D9357
MPYTSHGHAYGMIDTSQPRPNAVARCGGPRICAVCSREAEPQPVSEIPPGDPDQLAYTAAEKVARAFHQAYERLAPDHGYKTREATAVPWDDVPWGNKRLMIAVAHTLIRDGVISVPEQKPEPKITVNVQPKRPDQPAVIVVADPRMRA